MKLIDAKTQNPIELGEFHRLLIDAYKDLWVKLYGSEPAGWHPLPSDVGEDSVMMFIAFSEHQE